MHIKEVLGSAIMYFIVTFLTNSVTSEWIDIPQFSDESRVYREPFTKSHRHQIPFDRLFNFAENTSSNSTGNAIHQLKETMKKPLDVNVETTTLAYIAVNSDDIEEYTEVMQKITMSNGPLPNDPNPENDSAMPIPQVLTNDCNEKRIESLRGNTTTVGRYKWTSPKAEGLDGNGPFSFLQYLPIELIRRVHTILLGSTHAAIRDKREFLQKFQKSMLRKLESGLTPVFGCIREKRGSHWDDHRDHIGFPSLEGALLAISFLTFAVYLVQLVMMLLRNLASSGTPSTSTVLVNRNKRSIYQLSEDSARILEYIERFSSN